MEIERGPDDLVVGWRRALLDRDARVFALLFARDGVLMDIEHRTSDRGRAVTVRGREAIQRITVAWLGETPAFEYDVLDVIADDARAAVLWRYKVPGVEEPVRLDGVSWLECSGGEITRALVYFDSHALLRGLGKA